MREINLPTTNTIAFTIQASELSQSGILMPDGLRHISAGHLGEDEFAELEIARANAGKVLWSAICIEQKIDRVLINYPDDPASWTKPVVWLGVYSDEPFLKAANTPVLHSAFDQLIGEGRSVLEGENIGRGNSLCADHPMPTVLRSAPYGFYFYSNEQSEPPHVHIRRDNSFAKFWLKRIALAGSKRFSSRELRIMQGIIQEHRDAFLEAWNEHIDR